MTGRGAGVAGLPPPLLDPPVLTDATQEWTSVLFYLSLPFDRLLRFLSTFLASPTSVGSRKVRKVVSSVAVDGNYHMSAGNVMSDMYVA